MVLSLVTVWVNKMRFLQVPDAFRQDEPHLDLRPVIKQGHRKNGGLIHMELLFLQVDYAWNELPQPHDLTALGLSKVKPRFSKPS